MDHSMIQQPHNALSSYQHQITEHHRQAQIKAGEAVQHAIAAGKLLLAAKAEVKHGQWLLFLESTGINARAAQRYMRLAANEGRLKCDTCDAFGITEALEYLSQPKQTLYEVMCSRVHEYHSWMMGNDHSDIKLGASLHEAASKAARECREWIDDLDANELTLDQWAAMGSSTEPENQLAQARGEAERRANALIKQSSRYA